MAEKKLINNEPKFGDLSQYNFPDGYTTTPPEVNDSLSLPENSDKFQKKDLYTKSIGSELNEAIIERNLKFEAGTSYIRIEKLYISEDEPKKADGNQCIVWMFSQEKYPATDFDSAGYSTIKNALIPDGYNADAFYEDEINEIDDGKDWGQASGLEGQNIIQDLNANSLSIEIFSNYNENYRPLQSFALRDATEHTRIIDENIYNPIYFVIYLAGDETKGIGTDERKRRFQVYKINNLDLFDYDDEGNVIPKITYFDDINLIPRVNIAEGDGDGRGDEGPKWKVFNGDFHVSINTLGILANDWEDDPQDIENSIDYIGPDEKLYEQYFSEVQPPIAFSNDYNNPIYILNLSPKNQLNNNEKPGPAPPIWESIDYFPITNINIIDENGILQANDLQSYYDGDNELIIRQQTSAPATIGFRFNLVNYSLTDNSKGFFYFIIDWDDKDDKIKTLDDWENIRPTDLFELFELQNQNLYKMMNKVQGDSQSSIYSPTTTHTYNTPGIKTIKSIIFDYHDNGDGDFKYGRWKLVTSRFYLDIPINQYPDFGEVGGSDYTTIPWPFTTPIIGGVDEDSKYKISVQDTLSSGKIGDTDIIDERFLVNDLENDEMGKSINKMDLEQIRYFNKSYDINTLLNLNTVSEIVYDNQYLEDSYLSTLPFPTYFEEFNVAGNIEENIEVWNTDYARPDIGDEILNILDYLEATSLAQDFIPGLAPEFFDASHFSAEPVGLEVGFYFLDSDNINGAYYENFGFFGNDFMNADMSDLQRDVNNYEGNTFPRVRMTSNQFFDADATYQFTHPELETLYWYEVEYNNLYSDLKSGATLPISKMGSGEFIELIIPFKTISTPEYTLPPSIGEGVVLENIITNGDFTADVDQSIVTTDNLTGWTVNHSNDTFDYISLNNNQLIFNNVDSNFNLYIASPSNTVEDGKTYLVKVDIDSYTDDQPLFELGGGTNIVALEVGMNEFEWTPVFPDGNSGKVVVRRGGSTFPKSFTLNSISVQEISYTYSVDYNQYFNEEYFNSAYAEYTPYTDSFWDGDVNKFPMESSVGQIFISDNLDLDLKQSCKLELNTGELTGKSIYDSSGNSNKGLLIGDYKVKKNRKGDPMRRDSFIKVPKKTSNTNGAL